MIAVQRLRSSVNNISMYTIDLVTKNIKKKILILPDILSNRSNQCPPFFDGLLCWPSVLADSTAILPCPPQIVLGYENPNNGTSTKRCLLNGEWYRNSEGISWSNYTLCTPPPGHFVTAIENIEICHSEYGKTHNSSLLIVSQFNS